MSFTGDGIAIPVVPKPSNAKLQQLAAHVTAVPAHGTQQLSVFANAPVDNVDTSLKAGPRGPVSIDDPVARERISHFDHERIPERVVHARGVGAHGVFKLHVSRHRHKNQRDPLIMPYADLTLGCNLRKSSNRHISRNTHVCSFQHRIR